MRPGAAGRQGRVRRPCGGGGCPPSPAPPLPVPERGRGRGAARRFGGRSAGDRPAEPVTGPPPPPLARGKIPMLGNITPNRPFGGKKRFELKKKKIRILKMSEIRWSAARAGEAALVCKTKENKFAFLPWHLSPCPPREPLRAPAEPPRPRVPPQRGRGQGRRLRARARIAAPH